MLEGKDQQMSRRRLESKDEKIKQWWEFFGHGREQKERDLCVLLQWLQMRKADEKADEKQTQHWESGYLERTRRSFLSCFLWRSVHFLGILLSSISSAPATGLDLSLLWFGYPPGHGGGELFHSTVDLPAVAVLGLGTVHFFESSLPLVARKLPSQHLLCSVTSSHTTASQKSDLKLDSSSYFPQLCFQEQVFPEHSWEKVCFCSIMEELVGLTTVVVEVLLQEWAFILLIVKELLLVVLLVIKEQTVKICWTW